MNSAVSTPSKAMRFTPDPDPEKSPVSDPVSAPDSKPQKGKGKKADPDPAADASKKAAPEVKPERWPRFGPELAERIAVAVKLGELDSYQLFHLLTELFRSPKNAVVSMTILTLSPKGADLRDVRYTFSAIAETRKQIAAQLQKQEIV